MFDLFAGRTMNRSNTTHCSAGNATTAVDKCRFVQTNIEQLSLALSLINREATWHIISVAHIRTYICLYVCDTVIFESLVHLVYLKEIRVKFVYEGIVSRSRSQEQKWPKIPIKLQCKTSTGNNSSSIKHRTIKFSCSMGFSAMVDRMALPPSLSREQK